MYYTSVPKAITGNLTYGIGVLNRLHLSDVIGLQRKKIERLLSDLKVERTKNYMHTRNVGEGKKWILLLEFVFIP